MKRKWNLLLTPPLDAVTNMAIDSYLYRSHQIGEAPTLRLNTWQYPSFSLGFTHTLDTSILWKYRGWAFVRRLTGGGMVFHGKDLTYSIVFDAEQPWIPYRVRTSYLFLHTLVAEALHRLGLPAEVISRPNRSAEGICFQEPVEGDLLLNGKKIAGAGQKRGMRKVLHQGSIQIGEFRQNGIESLQRHLIDVFQGELGISFIPVEGFKQGGSHDVTRRSAVTSVIRSRVLGS